MPSSQPSISNLIETAFQTARFRQSELDNKWVALSMKVGLPSASINIQRAGSIDLVLRCMEDEFAHSVGLEASPPDFSFHYQKMLSEIWVAISYEILRAIRQRAQQVAQQPVVQPFDPSIIQKVSSLLVDLERLRMPLEKYEIAKDHAIKEPMPFVRFGGGAEISSMYDPQNPRRNHIMPSSVSDRGSIMWLALDVQARREYWLERREMADRFLAIAAPSA